MEDEKKKTSYTQISLHSIKNILGRVSEKSLFSKHINEVSDKLRVPLTGIIDRFGVDLTEIQARVMEGLLRGFTETSYKGNLEPKKKKEIEDQFDGELPDIYKYISEIPNLKVKQSQIIDWSGLPKKGISTWARSVESLHFLGTRQYCFYYDRLALDEKGNPIKQRDGRWKKEDVISVDTLFKIKEIRNKQTNELEYYEVQPSTLFLDQRESYFMMVPYNWREEVKLYFGNKKTSSYTFMFLLFLRYQYEIMRRTKKYHPPFKIKWSPQEIATTINMPESIYKRKKKRMNEILENAYMVAKDLGYLLSYERTSTIDILILSDNKYFGDSKPKKPVETLDYKVSLSANFLLRKFYETRKQIDQNYKEPAEKDKQKQLFYFSKLLEERTEDDIKQLIEWAFKKNFWSTRLNSPKQIYTLFSDAWIAMITSDKDYLKNNHKKLAKLLEQKISNSKNFSNKIALSALNKYVEIRDGLHSLYIDYDDNNFKEKIEEALKLRGFTESFT